MEAGLSVIKECKQDAFEGQESRGENKPYNTLFTYWCIKKQLSLVEMLQLKFCSFLFLFVKTTVNRSTALKGSTNNLSPVLCEAKLKDFNNSIIVDWSVDLKQ